MCHKDYCLAGAFEQTKEEVADQDAGLGVEGAEGLIHQEDGGVIGERSGHCDALAHAARELGGEALGRVGEFDLREQVAGARTGGCRAVTGQTQGEFDVRLRGLPGQQRVALEDEADAGLRAGIEGDAARGGPYQAGDGAEQGGLAAAGGADDGEELARGGGEGDVLHRQDGVGVADADVFDRYPGRCGVTAWGHLG